MPLVGEASSHLAGWVIGLPPRRAVLPARRNLTSKPCAPSTSCPCHTDKTSVLKVDTPPTVYHLALGLNESHTADDGYFARGDEDPMKRMCTLRYNVVRFLQRSCEEMVTATEETTP